ncbi:MAG: NADH:flavin oxidoreductase/NADH oxidase [Chitinophagaceae bacterium]|nr:MAG: NADH:flavin oxidoreductase/NADH oxidase [Chitinophagaceae bacterium]
MSLLFTPFRIKNLELKNRIVVSPMCQYSAVDGFANDWHLVHLGTRAVGGAGLVIAEATAVSPEGRISPADLGLWKDEQIDFLQRITSFIHQQGAVAGIQLAHAGRKASMTEPWKGNKHLEPGAGGWQTVAPAALAYAEDYSMPVAMDSAAISQCIQDFAAAAKRAVSAGFRLIEIHAAHGYLINQFLSPLSNNRTDSYGGSFENRIRFLLEIVTAVKETIGRDFPLLVRISATEWVEGGWDVTDSIELAKQLKAAGVDLVDCSTGGNSRQQKIDVGPLYQVRFAAQVKAGAGIATGAVGMISSAEEAESILQNGQADLVLLARQFLRDPYFPLHAATELNTETAWPDQYTRAK